MAANGDWRLANGEQRMANSKWRMVNENPQPATHNPILRFTHYASRSTHNPISGLKPLLPANFTLYASRFQLTTLNGTWDKGHGTKRQRLANGEQKTLKPSTRDPQPIFTLHASRITLNPQLVTLNSQPDFGANAPPTCQFYALRITLYAFSRPSSRSISVPCPNLNGTFKTL
jgi:hypothetical protein